MNKKGSTSIFLLVILAAMVAVTTAFVYAAKRAALTSYCDGLLHLAGKSVLSQFDLGLKERYGLFAFEDTGKQVVQAVTSDMNYALQPENADSIENIQVDFGSQQLGNASVLKKQILDHMKFALASDALGRVVDDGKQKDGAGGEEMEKDRKDKAKDRTLRNRKIIDSLPSFPLKESSPGFVEWIGQVKSQLGDWESIFDNTRDAYLVNRYIVQNFKNAQGGPDQYDTFFTNEVEYILEGDYSNQENYKQVRKGIVLLRSGLNAVHLCLDGEKRAEILAAAQMLTPGPAAVLTQAAIVGTWSLAEAENDASLLEKGRPVSVFKDKSTWATDLDSVLNDWDKGCIDTGSDRGLHYEDYLMVFLHFQNETVKLSRVMDLIQINMKGTDEKDFLIKTHNGGMRLNAKVNGRERTYDFQY